MNYCFTLAFNLPSEVEKITALLYARNKQGNFKHIIFDLGFPIVVGNEIPNSIPGAQVINSESLKATCQRYGSEYAKIDNIGVSQNWTQAFNYINPGANDILIGCDPDEHPQTDEWIAAMEKAFGTHRTGVVSLMMLEHIPLIKSIPHSEAFHGGVRKLFLPDGALNWALIGVSGELLKELGGVPVPDFAPVYGWIEGALMDEMRRKNYSWCVIPDYHVRHTDFELGDPGTSMLLRMWKNDIIYKIKEIGQPSFIQWLESKREELKNSQQ